MTLPHITLTTKTTIFAVALAVFGLISAPVTAQDMNPYSELPAGVYNLDKNHASLIWKVSHAGLADYTARFKSFDADITFDPTDITKSTVTATIDPTSLETDYDIAANDGKDFNKELSTGEQWLNAGKFPQITFTSTKIESTGDNTGKIHGDLTFLGVTKPVVLDAVLNGAYLAQPFNQKPTLGVSATTTIKRSDWGFSTYVPTIGDEVTIIIEGEFNKND